MERFVLGIKNYFTSFKTSEKIGRKTKKKKPSELASPEADFYFIFKILKTIK